MPCPPNWQRQVSGKTKKAESKQDYYIDIILKWAVNRQINGLHALFREVGVE